jgi:hypothetical protein
MGGTVSVGFIGKQRHMNATEHDVCAPMTRESPEHILRPAVLPVERRSPRGERRCRMSF